MQIPNQVWAFVAGGALVYAAVGHPAVAAGQAPTYEYHMEIVSTFFTDTQLNKVGAMGWEPIGLSQNGPGGYAMLCRRPKP